ncbi:unnamed protein product [Parajaminaea phylloscopi]
MSHADADARDQRILVLSLDGCPLSVLEGLVNSITQGDARADTATSVATSPEGETHGNKDVDGAHQDEDDDGAAVFETSRPANDSAADSAGPSSSTVAGSQEGSGSPSQQLTWRIDNRYYTAEVHFRCVSIPLAVKRSQSRISRHATPETSVLKARLRDELQGVTAIILVVGGGDKHTRNQGSIATAGSASSRAGLEQASQSHASYLALLQECSAESDAARLSDEVTNLGVTPLGFELAVSVVVALPSERAPPRADTPASDVVELYAEQGWEYVDLAIGLGGTGSFGDSDESDSDSDDADDDVGRANGSREGEDEHEAEGLERVREALEANMWPGLERKSKAQSDRARDTDESSLMGTKNGDSARSGGRLDSDEDGDEALESMLRNLNLGLPVPSRDAVKKDPSSRTSSKTNSAGESSSEEASLAGALLDSTFDPTLIDGASLSGLMQTVQPTKEDEELAQRFLQQIADFERASTATEASSVSTLPETEEQRKLKQAEALRRLEEFLASEDPNWPAPPPGNRDQPPRAFDSSGASGSGEGAPSGFDEDFDGFVTALDGTAPSDAGALANPELSLWPEADVSAWGIQSDKVAPETRVDATTFNENDPFGLGSGMSLARIQSEAQRVRSMAGTSEEKEQEAERVVGQMLEKWDLQ